MALRFAKGILNKAVTKKKLAPTSAPDRIATSFQSRRLRRRCIGPSRPHNITINEIEITPRKNSSWNRGTAPPVVLVIVSFNTKAAIEPIMKSAPARFGDIGWLSVC